MKNVIYIFVVNLLFAFQVKAADVTQLTLLTPAKNVDFNEAQRICFSKSKRLPTARELIWSFAVPRGVVALDEIDFFRAHIGTVQRMSYGSPKQYYVEDSNGYGVLFEAFQSNDLIENSDGSVTQLFSEDFYYSSKHYQQKDSVRAFTASLPIGETDRIYVFQNGGLFAYSKKSTAANKVICVPR